MWKEFGPYIFPLIAAVLIVRRATRARKVRFRRMWFTPAIAALVTAAALVAAPPPGLPVMAAFVAAFFFGAGLGYLRARHMHLTLDPATGAISSRSTATGTICILVLFAARFGLRQLVPGLGQPGHGGAAVAQISDGLLIFTVATLAAQAVTIWSRTRPLLTAHGAGAPDAIPPAG